MSAGHHSTPSRTAQKVIQTGNMSKVASAASRVQPVPASTTPYASAAVPHTNAPHDQAPQRSHQLLSGTCRRA